MIIVRLIGGMGNQMFQYALHLALLAQGKEVKLDWAKYIREDENRRCFLDYGCFDLDYEMCTKAEARKYILGTGVVARAFTRLFGDKHTHYYEPEKYRYLPDVMQMQEGYLDGFWQTWKYFQDIESDIRRVYRFQNELTGKNKEYEIQIKNSNSCAVHVRRGDYLQHQKEYGNICTIDYYKKAIEKIEETVTNPVFYLFSDEIAWVRETFGNSDNYVYVEGNGEDKGYNDMRLMSGCRHQIIANSTFSWWAAYLNDNPDKKVICPRRWVNDKEASDLYCDEWLKI